jgi:hypothetical protein
MPPYPRAAERAEKSRDGVTSMLITILVAEIMLAIFLGGELIIVLAVTRRHGDPSATYKLRVVLDKLIAAAVFKGIDRDNPWLDALYENTNRVLLPSKLQPFPITSEECPAAIRELVPELRAALEHLVHNHMRLGIQLNAQRREQRRIQRETAKRLLQMMLDDARCGGILAESA